MAVAGLLRAFLQDILSGEAPTALPILLSAAIGQRTCRKAFKLLYTPVNKSSTGGLILGSSVEQ